MYHRQIHRAIIELDAIQEIGDTEAEWRLRALNILVEELCHAYIGIYYNCKTRLSAKTVTMATTMVVIRVSRVLKYESKRFL